MLANRHARLRNHICRVPSCTASRMRVGTWSRERLTARLLRARSACANEISCIETSRACFCGGKCIVRGRVRYRYVVRVRYVRHLRATPCNTYMESATMLVLSMSRCSWLVGRVVPYVSIPAKRSSSCSTLSAGRTSEHLCAPQRASTVCTALQLGGPRCVNASDTCVGPLTRTKGDRQAQLHVQAACGTGAPWARGGEAAAASWKPGSGLCTCGAGGSRPATETTQSRCPEGESSFAPTNVAGW